MRARPDAEHPRRKIGPTGLVALMRARVLIRPKAGILDPQGLAVEQALPALGFSDVRDVHVGRLVELELDDPGDLEAMCEKLLANPLIEDYEVELLDGAGAGAGAQEGGRESQAGERADGR